MQPRRNEKRRSSRYIDIGERRGRQLDCAHRRRRRNKLLPLAFLLKDKEVVKPAQKEISLLGRLAIISHLQRLVVAHDGDDVDRLKILSQTGEELKPNGKEPLSLHKRIA